MAPSEVQPRNWAPVALWILAIPLSLPSLAFLLFALIWIWPVIGPDGVFSGNSAVVAYGLAVGLAPALAAMMTWRVLKRRNRSATVAAPVVFIAVNLVLWVFVFAILISFGGAQGNG